VRTVSVGQEGMGGTDQLYEYGGNPPEAFAHSVTVEPTGVEFGLTATSTVRGAADSMGSALESDELAMESVTIARAANLPTVVYSCDAVALSCKTELSVTFAVPSPKSHVTTNGGVPPDQVAMSVVFHGTIPSFELPGAGPIPTAVGFECEWKPGKTA